MGFRFNKRVKVANGVNINLSRKGISTSVKVGNTSINTRGRVTTSIPGTGVSYSSTLNVAKKDNTKATKVVNENVCAERSEKEIRINLAAPIRILGVIFIVFGIFFGGTAVVALIKSIATNYWEFKSFIIIFGGIGALLFWWGRCLFKIK